MTTGIQIRDMRTEVSTSLIETIYHELLEPSFGFDELDPLDTVLDGLAEGGSQEVWGLCAMDGEKPVGCIFGYPHARSQVLVIGYLAARPGLRGHGIGAMLLDQVRQRWFEEPGIKLVVAEVQDPRSHAVLGDIDPERRVAFYSRRGWQVVVGPYFQPRCEGEERKRVYDVFLCVVSEGQNGTSPKDSVPARQIAEFLLEYFEQSGDGPDWPQPDDEEGARLLAWYQDPNRIEVRLHPIDDYARIEIPQITDHGRRSGH
jgi:GNAT superfamily N-acetyltransferase